MTDIDEIALVQQLSSDVELEGKAEQDLGQVVMEVPRDLEALVCTFLGHGVRELAEDLLTLGQLDMSFLERVRTKKHLTCEKKRSNDGENGKERHVWEVEQPGQYHAENCEPRIAHEKLAKSR